MVGLYRQEKSGRKCCCTWRLGVALSNRFLKELSQEGCQVWYPGRHWMPIYGHLVPQRWSRPAAALGESERRRQSSREAPPAPPKENNTQFTPSTPEGKKDSVAPGDPCYLCVSQVEVALMVPWKSSHCATRWAADDLLLYHISISKVWRKITTGSGNHTFWADLLGLGKSHLNYFITGCISFRGSFSPAKQSLILRKTEPQHCRDGNVRSEVDGRVHDNLSGARENSRFLSRVVVSARQLLMYNPSTQEEA